MQTSVNQTYYKYYKYYTKNIYSCLKKNIFSVLFCSMFVVYFCSMETTIKQWVKDPKRSYKVGVELLDNYCKNRHLVRFFQNTVERYGMKKLTYELSKLAAKIKEDAIEEQFSVVDNKETHQQKTEDSNEGQLPVFNVAKKLVHELWVEISRITEELYNVGTVNDKDSKEKRKALLSERLPLIERFNIVYEAKELFFCGELTEEQLKVVMEGSLEENNGDEKNIKLVNFEKMSDLDLIKKMHSTKQAINRAKNQLLYQQDSKGEAENPLPDCPRRREIEERLSVKQAELNALLAEFESRGINGNA